MLSSISDSLKKGPFTALINRTEALVELEQILQSKQGNFTSEEANVLMTCAAKVRKDMAVGAGVGAGVVWLATRSLVSNLLRINRTGSMLEMLPLPTTRILGNLFRISLTGVAACSSALWKARRSTDSCVEHILSLDGSQMQKELANIMLKKHQDDPWIMQHISKHFYSEKVLTSDQPKLRWRYRNFFGDTVAHSQRTNDSESYSENTDADKSDLEPKQR